MEGWKAGQNKRLRRMSLEAEVWDLADWWRLAEGMCLRAGKLRRRICLDKARVLRMMETNNMDRILSETPAWWNMVMAWTGSDSSLVEEPSYQEKHPTSLQDIEEGRQQEGAEDGCVEPAPTTPEEVETCVGGRYPTKNTPNTRAPDHLSGRMTRLDRKRSIQDKTLARTPNRINWLVEAGGARAGKNRICKEEGGIIQEEGGGGEEDEI